MTQSETDTGDPRPGRAGLGAPRNGGLAERAELLAISVQKAAPSVAATGKA